MGIYREFADCTLPRIKETGCNIVQLMAIMHGIPVRRKCAARALYTERFDEISHGSSCKRTVRNLRGKD